MIQIDFDRDKVMVTGEIDIFCAEELKVQIKEHEFTANFTVDLNNVPYIDSSGIGALISLYNYFEKLNISFHIVASENVKKIFSISKLDSLFFKDEKTQVAEQKSIIFHDSFEADTKILAYLIDNLFRDLSTAKYNEEEAHEIVVAVDEAITNAILETIKATGEVDDNLSISLSSAKVKSIAVKWEITPTEFFATVIDHGAGLDLATIKNAVPQVSKDDYLGQVKKYQDKCNLHMRVNGIETEIKRLGAGLKIMASFMDAIFIDLIDSKNVISDKVEKSTTGTILNLYRHRRIPA